MDHKHIPSFAEIQHTQLYRCFKTHFRTEVKHKNHMALAWKHWSWQALLMSYLVHVMLHYLCFSDDLWVRNVKGKVMMWLMQKECIRSNTTRTSTRLQHNLQRRGLMQGWAEKDSGIDEKWRFVYRKTKYTNVRLCQRILFLIFFCTGTVSLFFRFLFVVPGFL